MAARKVTSETDEMASIDHDALTGPIRPGLVTPGGVRFIAPEEGKAVFDARVRRLLGISGEEFLRRADAGEYDGVVDDPDHPELIDLFMLIPLVR